MNNNDHNDNNFNSVNKNIDIDIQHSISQNKMANRPKLSAQFYNIKSTTVICGLMI